MTYMGSKRKYAKDIVPIIQDYIDKNNIKTFVDVFCGGANLADKIKCDRIICNDLSPTLIGLHQMAQSDFSKIPVDGNRDYWNAAYAEYKKIKQAMDKGETYTPSMPLYKIGAIEWYASFASGGFPRGYAKNSDTRNYYQEGYRNHQKQSQDEIYKKIVFWQGNYLNLIERLAKQDIDFSTTLFYCDSPYKGTKPYAICPNFNHNDYYDWCRKASSIVPLFISEQEMPEDFPVFWSKKVARTAGLDNNFKACEKLYFIDRREDLNDKRRKTKKIK